MPHTCRSQYPSGSVQLGGFRMERGQWCGGPQIAHTCESAPKRDPGQNSSKSLKSSAKTPEVGGPIGADRDPTRNKISFNVSRS
jgi:hypothetical protein